MSELLKTELRQMMAAYLDGRRDKVFVSEIEGLVIEGFQDEAWFDDVSEDLALFVPGGGTYYLDEEALAVTFRKLLEQLEVGGDGEQPGDAGQPGLAQLTDGGDANSAGAFSDSVINCTNDSGEASTSGGG